MSDLETSLRSALPANLHGAVPPLAQLLAAVISGKLEPVAAQERIAANEELKAVLQALSGQRVEVGGKLLSFEGANTGDVNIGVVAGRDVVTINLAVHQPAPSPAFFQLRAPTADFVGREKEIAQLVEALTKVTTSGAAAAISGIRGMGGIGKTELALKVAHELREDFPDGQLLVELRGASSSPLTPELALQTAIRAFEREAKLPDDLSQLQGIYRSVLAGKRVFVMADDARDALQVRPLLPPAGCALLVTSRNRFALPGMVGLDLGTLQPAEAEALLLEIRPRIGEHAPELARLCGYLPLALRVSASLLANSSRPVERYLEQLEQARLVRLADPDNPGDPTTNVEASLRLSYEALGTSAQEALCQLSVFPTSFDLAAAQAVVRVEGEVEEVLDLLIRRSLLEWDTALGRYSLHDLVREFGAAHLPDREAVRLRHAQHYAGVAYHAEDEFYPEGAATAGLALFDQERTHIDRGWGWALAHAGEPAADTLLCDYASATADIAPLRYHPRHERIPRLKAALAAARRLGHSNLGWLFANLGRVYHTLGDRQTALIFLQQDLAIARELGDRRSEGRALSNLAIMYADLEDTRKALDYFQQDLAIARELGDRSSEGMTLGNLGNIFADLGDTHKAIDYHQQHLGIVTEIGDRAGIARTSWNLGLVLEQQGQLVRAVELMQVNVDYLREIGHPDAEKRAAYLAQLRRLATQEGNTPAQTPPPEE